MGTNSTDVLCKFLRSTWPSIPESPLVFLTVIGTRTQVKAVLSHRSCRSSFGDLVAGSYGTPFFPRHKRRALVATQSEADAVCGPLLGGHRKGCWTNRPYCGMSLCFVTYFVIRPDAHNGGTFGELPASGDFWGAASSLCAFSCQTVLAKMPQTCCED